MKDKEAIQIHSMYEYHLNHLHTYSTYEQMMIGNNIAELNYIDDLLDRNTVEVSNWILRKMSVEVSNHTIPVDVLSLSAFVFKGKERGLNVEPLINAMNIHGEWLISEELKRLNKNALLN